MTTYCVPDSITPRPIKPGVATVETIEAIMADGPCAILPVAGAGCVEKISRKSAAEAPFSNGISFVGAFLGGERDFPFPKREGNGIMELETEGRMRRFKE